MIRKRSLNRLEQLINAGRSGLWKDQQVHVFGHVNKRDQLVPMPLHCQVDAVSEHAEPGFIGQQRQSLVARESQFMEVAGFIEVLDFLAVDRRWFHGRNI